MEKNDVDCIYFCPIICECVGMIWWECNDMGGQGGKGGGNMQSLALKLFISVSILSISNYGSLLLHLIASHLCIRTQLRFLNMYVQMDVL
jgi:hypothetical protein